MHHTSSDDALSAPMAADSIPEVPASKGKKRGHSIWKIDWWCEAATAAFKASGKTYEDIAKELAATFDYKTDKTMVGRCLAGDPLTLKLAEHLSAILEIPPPIYIPKNIDDALKLLGKRELERVRAQVAVLRAGVEKSADGGHPPGVASKDERPGGPRTKR